MDRLIVTSSAYQRSSAPDEARSKIDPQNRLFWRMNRKRFDAELIRDATLSIAGTLNPKIGGRPVRIPIEPEVYDLIFTESERDGLWPVSAVKSVQNRRGIYLFNKRSVPCRCSAFDQPDAVRRAHRPYRLMLYKPSRSSTPVSCRRCRSIRSGWRNPAQRIAPARSIRHGSWHSRRPRVPERSAKVLSIRQHLPDFCLTLFSRTVPYVP
jgi:hypothetical protein